MAKGASAFRPPSVWYWILAVVPLLSYIAAAIYAYFIWESEEYMPVPSIVAGYGEAGYCFGIPAVLVVISIWAVSWRAFRRFMRSARIPRRTFSQQVPLFVFPGIGAIGGVLYALMGFVTIQTSFNWHVGLHIGTLGALWLFLVGSSRVMSETGYSKVDFGLWVYDGMVLLIEIMYGVMLIFYRVKDAVSFQMLSVIAYAAVGLQFARFPIHGWQLLGAEFVFPLRALRPV
jgi:hypothetical protein